MLLFKPSHVEPILLGRKTETRRVWAKPRATVGGLHWCTTQLYNKGARFARVEILKVHQERLGATTDDGALAEGYATLAGFRAIWVDIHGRWTPDLFVTVVSFELVGGWCPADVRLFQRVREMN